MKSYLNLTSFKTVNPVTYKSETAATSSSSLGSESFRLSFSGFKKFVKMLFFEKDLSSNFQRPENKLAFEKVEVVEAMEALEFQRVETCQRQCEIG